MSSRKEEKERARAERERKEQEAAAAHKRKRRFQIGGGAVAVVAIAVAAIAIASSSSSSGGGKKGKAPGAGSVAALARAAGCTVINHPAEGHNHVNGPVQYKTNPPSSGNHYPVPASDGEYTTAPTVTHLVHALEHGRVILWYRPGTSPAVVAQLRLVFNKTQGLEILTPNNTGMPYEVAASNWTGDRNASSPPPEVGHVLGCPKMNAKVPAALEAFIAQYKGKGPERINVPE